MPASASAAKPRSSQLHSSQRLPELDGLRAIALLLVIIFHYFVYDLRLPDPALYVTLWSFQIGWSGVDLFFVLSGFLIGGILLDHKESARLLTTFYVRRICRIFPLYFLLVLVFIGGCYLLDNGIRTKLALPFRDHGPVWAYATFTQNYWMAINNAWGAAFNGVTWSLAIEEHFYLLLPILIFIVPGRLIPWTVLLVGIGSVACRMWQVTVSSEAAVDAYLMTHLRLDGLCSGVLVAYALRVPGVWDWIRGRRALLYAACIMVPLGYFFLNWRDPRLGTVQMAFYGYSLLAVLYSLVLIVAITFVDSLPAAILRVSALRFIGKLSFCLYLIHQPVNVLSYAYLRHKLPALDSWADLLAPLVAFALSIGLAALSWRYFESPLIRYGQRRSYEAAEPPKASVFETVH